MERLTKKSKLFKGYTRDFAISNVIYEMTYKLGQLEDIERELGLLATNVSKCCRGIIKSLGGYVWKYATIEKEVIEQWTN